MQLHLNNTMCSMTKVCKMYLALCFVFGFYTASVVGLFSERILKLESYKFGPCKPAQHNESQDFTLLEFSVRVTDCGDMHFTASFKTTSTVTSPLMATIDLRKSILFGLMFRIPCFGSFGSCTIQDMCDFGVPDDEECPPLEEEVDFPCRCPIEPGTYRMPGVWISDLAKTRWTYLFTGYYTAMITLYQDGTEMTCYKIEFTLE